jgi:exopolyphosphatase/guanosine-5'-triphosphate,3'-diphosphate pyrophosphatase
VTDISEKPSAELLTESSNSVMAAVDLGSNSFQLLIANFSHGQLKVVDRLREMVRIAAGLDENGNLDEASQRRALDCLARFGERLRDIPAGQLRAVGTNTLRKARNPAAFIEQAQQLLGHDIDIIAGIEEARLIYVGVSRTLPVVEGEQLVIDIGGGSTEIALGEGYQPNKLVSLHMGCVGISRAYFPNGKVSAKRFKQARTAARLELRPVVKRFRREQLQRAAGASGTIRAAANVLLEMGLIQRNITIAGLESLIEKMVEYSHVDNFDLPGLNDERAPVFPGGIAILVELMRELRLDELVVTQGALREGILYDLVGRQSDEDSRVRTIRAMAQRYHVDQEQADRVELTAIALLNQVADEWQLDEPAVKRLLGWAARLYEIGLDIAHAQYHHHGAYLLKHSDMPGFHRNEQRILACLVGEHRRKLSADDIAGEVPMGWAKRATHMAVLLRLAVLFNRSRTYGFPDALKISVDKHSIKLSLTEAWLQQNPLTCADLEQEQAYLKASGYQLDIIAATD